MLTFQTTALSIDNSGTADPYADPTSTLTFEAPNPQVAMAFVSAFNAIDASTWSDCHTSLGWNPQVVDGPCLDPWGDHMSWEDIQADRCLREEMRFWPQSTAVV